MPWYRCDDSNDESTKKSCIENALDPIRNTKDIFVTFFDIDSGDAGNEEHLGKNTDLMSN